MKGLLGYCGVMFTVLLFCPVHGQVPLYRLTELESLPGGNTSIIPWDINNNGQIVGQSSTTNDYDRTVDHAFLWENGQTKDIGDLPGGDACSGSVAYSINESGQIVGYGSVNYTYSVPGEGFGRMLMNARMAFMYQDGVLRGMDDYTGGKKCTIAWGINDWGQVVGQVQGGEYQYASSAFLTNADATIDQGYFFAEPDGRAISINNNGQVIGVMHNASLFGNQTDPFIWSETEGVRMLGLIETVLSEDIIIKSGEARRINDTGYAVGHCFVVNESGRLDHKAVIWDLELQPVVLDNLPGGSANMAMDINIHNQIVGWERSAFTSLPHDCAVLWQDGIAYDLNTLLDETGAGWQLTGASAINDNGWIVGIGVNPDGFNSAFLLTPIPEPGTLLLLGVGAVAFRQRFFS